MSESLADLEAEIIAADNAARHVEPCKICIMLPQLSGARREIVQRGLGSAIGYEKLAKILTKGGLDVSRRSIQTHRSEGHQ